MMMVYSFGVLGEREAFWEDKLLLVLHPKVRLTDDLGIASL